MQVTEEAMENADRPLDLPCNHPPGSAEKVETLKRRYESGMELWNPSDVSQAVKWSARHGFVGDVLKPYRRRV